MSWHEEEAWTRWNYEHSWLASTWQWTAADQSRLAKLQDETDEALRSARDYGQEKSPRGIQRSVASLRRLLLGFVLIGAFGGNGIFDSLWRKDEVLVMKSKVEDTRNHTCTEVWMVLGLRRQGKSSRIQDVLRRLELDHLRLVHDRIKERGKTLRLVFIPGIPRVISRGPDSKGLWFSGASGLEQKPKTPKCTPNI